MHSSILIVDDHPLLREGIAAVIENQPDMQVVAEAGTGQEAIDLFCRHLPDLTLMDLVMPAIDGVEAIVAIRAQHPQARVVILTTYGGDAKALRALKAGASGYLLKSLIRTELLDAIRSVHGGRRSVAREVAAELAMHVGEDSLTERKLEVLCQVAGGNSNRRAATHLGISKETVKAHMKNIFGKLSANDRTHAVTIALKRGVIDI